MWRQALSELRLHPGRFVATLVAIAISVGFIAAISVFINTEQSALGKSNTMPLANADLYVSAEGLDVPELAAAIERVDGVRAVHPVPLSMPMVLTHGDQSVMSMVYTAPHPDLQWSTVLEGRMPEGDDELALSQAGLDALGIKVGEAVSLDSGGELKLTVFGATDDPKSLWSAIGYVGSAEGQGGAAYAVLLDPGVSAGEAVASISAATGSLDPGVGVSTAQAERQRQLDHLTQDFDVFKYMLQTFGVVALVVGMITIANTFTILVAQRRRQIGLLRAVGASPGQVMGRLVVESFLLGLAGSLLGIGLGFGVAAIGGSITGSLYWGLDVRWGELGFALLVGILATMVSSIAPAVVASRVKPLEALQVVPTAAQVRRAGTVRLIVVLVAALAGAALVVMSRVETETSVLWAVGAGVLLTVAVLGAAPFFVPPMLRGLGAAFGRLSPTARLAFTNAGRNPKRAAATATALMLAVGLIVTLQVALATVRTSGTESIFATYPVDFAVTFQEDGMPADLVERLEAIGNVDDVQPTVEGDLEGLSITLEDRGDVTSINQVMKVLETVPGADFSASGAGAILVLNQVLDVMLIVLTGLLGVAVVIALVGVSNTLGLSVIERQRESALLRALGMQRSGLRWMLLIEAIALVVVGVVVGLAAGMFFGWLGVSSALLMMPGENMQLHFSIDVLYTVGLIGVCLVAAVLASLLPGQKAASAPPTEALAAE